MERGSPLQPSTKSGDHHKLPGAGPWPELNLFHFSRPDHFWHNSSMANKQQNIWPFMLFLHDVIFRERNDIQTG